MKQDFMLFILTALLSAAGAYGLMSFFQLEGHSAILLAGFVFLFFLTAIILFMGPKLSRSEDKGAFTRFCFMITILKLFAVSGFYVFYAYTHPAMDLLWVFPYLWIYVIFTSYEVWYMMKIS